jgi:glycosyltransferase involved in cell wall biosynthesis
MSRRRRVLFISYYFPPSGGSGVQRPLKFVKYLPRHGWEPVVLTVKPDTSFPARDENLSREIPEETEVHRTKMLDPYVLYRKIAGSGGGPVDVETVARWDHLPARARWMSRIRAALFVPDARIGWWPFAVPAARRIHESNPVDVVFSTGPPFTTHLIGKTVARRIRRPWVADYRDPWTRALFYPPRPGAVRKLDRWLEGRCLRRARRNVVVVPTMVDEFLADHVDLDRGTFDVISNGFDPEDFENVSPQKEEKWTVVHSGSLFANRRPETFFKVMRDLLEENPERKETMRLVFVGRMDSETRLALGKPPLAHIVDDRGYVPHTESVAWLRRGHLLLLPVGSGPEVKHLATGKIFEYLASGTPLLALAPPGEASRIIQETGTGFTVDPGDEAGIREILLRSYDAHQKRRLITTERDEGEIASYSRAALTERLSGILNEISAEGK